MSDSMDTIDHLMDLLAAAGSQRYGGEAVSQLQHALQCATLAEAAGETDALVVAALLHDIGHLVHDLGDSCASDGVDDAHERRGERLLAAVFPPEVVAPIRLHVAAKRYLCRIDPVYLASLSPASKLSLELQGGAFDALEAEAFAAGPHAVAAIMLRRWDDLAKDPSRSTPGLEHFRPRVEGCRLAARA
jgi:phosphonate degradation associated HDIG domain protein